ETELLVVYDDLDLELGRLRLRKKGSAGGHNGIKSILAQGLKKFVRVRLGIGSPPKSLGPNAVVYHVLGQFSAEETDAVQALLNLTADAVDDLAEGVTVDNAAVMKYRQYNPNAKFSMLNQRDGIDEDYSDRENGEESCLNPRRLLGLCLCCSCVLLLPLLTAAFFLNSWATDAVEAAGMQTFGVPTSVGSVEISPLSARWSLSDLEVASPPGFGQYSFLTLGSGVFDLSFRSVIFNPLQLQELTLQDVHLNIDQHVDGSSNAKSIMEHITKASSSAQSKQFNEVIMTKKVIVDKISFSNIVTRLCLHPSCEMSPPPYFVIKKVEVSDVGKKEGGVYVPDLLQVIVRAVVVAAIRAAPHQLGNPLAESLGAGLLQALDYAQIHYASWMR
ncbi:unnamed protein product, partial [Effrenium voratum]